MKIPQLRKKPEIKSCHNVTWEDNYSWIHQENILEVLKDSSKLLPEVKKYLEEENSYTEYNLKDTKKHQKEIFDEIKGRIKLDDESLPFKDKEYEYWNKTTTEGNYSIKLRKKIGSKKIEEIWNGDKEKAKLKTEYFGIGDLEVSNNDKYLGYSLDLKGSEYFTIYIRDIDTGKLITEKIEETSGSITFSLDDKYIFPGGYTPSLSEVTNPIENAGLIVTDIEVLRLHYSHTLRHWKENCIRNKEKIIKMFDEKFFRMWEFYLAGCEMAFKWGDQVVYQFQLTKNYRSTPVTRDYIYQ